MASHFDKPDAAPLLAIADAIKAARALLAVLQREAKALAAMKIHAPTGFAEAKTRLTATYAESLRALAAAGLAPEEEPALAELVAVNAELKAAALHNTALLQGAIDANRRMIAILANAQALRRAPVSAWYAHRRQRAATPTKARRPAAGGSCHVWYH